MAVAYERALKTVFNRETKTVVYEVVAYGRWSLTRSGRYERVDCNSNNNNNNNNNNDVLLVVLLVLRFISSSNFHSQKYFIYVHKLLTIN